MPRDLPLSNGELLVNVDLDYRIRDIYFPWIGQENHACGNEFRFGVWADGAFSWMGPGWEKDLRYRDDSLTTDVLLTNRELGLSIHCQDIVDFQANVYVRRLDVLDLTGRARDIRLFFSHDFHLYGHEIGDTAFFDPGTKAIIHYKRSRYFLVDCRSENSDETHYFSCGTREAAGVPASWRDAEDGELSGSPIAWGFAESTVGVRLRLVAGGTATAYYWMAAGTDYQEVADLNRLVARETPAGLIERTSTYWQAWCLQQTRQFADLPRAVTDLFHRSLLIIRSQIDNHGAIVAANDSDIVRFGGDTYSYVWGRDGAFVAAALDRAGYSELAARFFDFCSAALSSGGFLFQHYNPDGTLASNWHAWLLEGAEVLPIQEDSTALVLWALWIHYERSKDIESVRPLYENLVLKAADFLRTYRDPETVLPTPSYDLWEERYAVHAYTVAAVIRGLRAAANFGRVFHDSARVEEYERAADDMTAALEKHFYHAGLKRYARSGQRTAGGYDLDGVVDVSLLALATFEVFDSSDERVIQTANAVRDELRSTMARGGFARYFGDQYQREADVPEHVAGNPWFISALWLAEYEILTAHDIEALHAALPYLEWCVANALPSGVLAEQVHPRTGAPLSVSPLTWSHSAYVWAVLAYADKFHELQVDAGRVALDAPV